MESKNRRTILGPPDKATSVVQWVACFRESVSQASISRFNPPAKNVIFTYIRPKEGSHTAFNDGKRLHRANAGLMPRKPVLLSVVLIAQYSLLGMELHFHLKIDDVPNNFPRIYMRLKFTYIVRRTYRHRFSVSTPLLDLWRNCQG